MKKGVYLIDIRKCNHQVQIFEITLIQIEAKKFVFVFILYCALKQKFIISTLFSYKVKLYFVDKIR